MIVRGSAGVGKSRIVREALAGFSSGGGEARWIVATTSARALPLGALSDWVESTDTGDLGVVREVIDALTSASGDSRVVIGVDDVFLLDDLSTFVMHQIVQRGVAKMVFTVRDGSPIPVATQELWEAGQFDSLVLQPLSREESTALVSATLGGPLDPDAAQRLWLLTRGNVLYLRNIVEQEVADGRLAQHGGHWRWTGEPVMPDGLVELIESRMGALPNSVTDVIDALAVAEPIDLAVLGSITGSSAIEDADERGLITVEPTDRGMDVRVAHPLYAEVRRKRAAPTRLRRLRGLIANQLATVDNAEDIHTVVRRAALSLDSDLAPDAALLARAAQGAVSLADMPLADRLAGAAICAGAGVDAYFTRSWALAWIDPQQADAVLASIPTSGFTEHDRVFLACFRASGLLWGLADPDGAKRVIDDVARIAASEQARTVLDAWNVMYLASMAQPLAASRLAAGVDFEQLPPVTGAAASWALVVAHGDSGATTDAVAAAQHGYTIVARAREAPHMHLVIGDRHVGALLQSGRIAEARSVADALHTQTADLPGVAELLSTAVEGRAALGAGRLLEAHSLLQPVLEMFFATGDVNGFGYRYQIADVTALAMCDLVEEAGAGLAHLEQHRYPSWQFVDYERSMAQAWVAACEGAVSEARAICLMAAETSRANGQFAAEVWCLQTAVQFGDRSCGPRLGELEAVVEGPRVGVAARFAAGLHDGDAAKLAVVSRQFEDMGDLVAAVDAAAHAGIEYRRQDLRGSALGCSTRADELAEHCGASTPALRHASERVPLTVRQREIVELLGQGLSNPAIAERLTLSRRTVEAHIYRAMAKTGTASRAELAALIPRRDPVR